MIELQTMGPAVVRRDGERLDGLLAHEDAFALLVHLCLEGGSSRKRLAELWPGDEEAGLRTLDEALRVLRREAGEDVVVSEAGHLRCREGRVRCDARRLEDAAAEGDWVTVDRLSRGPFLDGVSLPDGGWREWREATAEHLERLTRRARSELRAAGEPSSPAPMAGGLWTGGLLGKLRARDVVQVSAIYVAAAWAGLQAVDTLIQRGLLPEWVFVTGLGIGAVGLVVVVSVAWLQETEAVGEDDAWGPRWIPKTTTRRLVVGLGAAAVLLLGVFIVLQGTLPDAPGGSDASGSGTADLRSVAVLYFDDHSPEQNLEPIAAGFTDALIHHLTQVPVLEVPSRNAVKRYRDGEIGLDSLIADLDVGAYVEGGVTGTEDSLQVTVQLIDASTGRHVESATLRAAMDDVLSLRDELAEEVARILRRRLGTEIRLQELRADAENREAWVLVQRAEGRREDARALGRTDRTAARRALETADSLLARAESLDPEWVTPVVLRGWTAAQRALLETDLPGNYHPEWGRRALEHAERAVSTSDGHPEALELRGRVRFGLAETPGVFRSDSLYLQAQQDLEAAVSADSTLARAWVTLSDLFERKAQHAEAKRAAERALEADYYLREAREVTFRLWSVTLELEQQQEAARWCREGRRRWPRAARFLQCRLYNMASFPEELGDVERGWAAVDTMLELTADAQREVIRGHASMWMAQVAAGRGLQDSARAIISRTRGPEPDSVLAYNEAHARLLMGEEERALDLLEMYVRYSPNRGGESLAGDWWFRPLRDHPRFQRLVEEGPAAASDGTGP